MGFLKMLDYNKSILYEFHKIFFNLQILKTKSKPLETE